MKHFSKLFIIVILLFALSSCSLFNVVDAPDKEFKCDDLSITLTSGFAETEMDGCDFAFDSMKIAVFGFKESFSLFDKGTTLDDYAELIYKANIDQNPSDIKTEDGLVSTYYETYDEDEKTTYSYFIVMYEGLDSFWCIQFFCETKNYEEYNPYFIKWAKSVKFEA